MTTAWRSVLASVATTLALLAPGTAHPVDLVVVVSASQEGELARIVGAADFQGEPEHGGASWVDPAGDLFQDVPGDLGKKTSADLVSAHIRWPNARDPESNWALEFRVMVDQLAPPFGGTPEATLYLWEFAVDGGRPFALWAMRSSQWQAPGSDQPAFRLISCPEEHSGFAAGCRVVAPLTGWFDLSTDAIVAYVPFSLVGAHEGSRIGQGEIVPGHGGGFNISSRIAVASGATWAFERLDAMSQADAYVVPVRQGGVAVSPPEARLEDVTGWAPASIGEDGSTFEGTIDISGLPSGDYRAWVRACLVDDCKAASRPFTVT